MTSRQPIRVLTIAGSDSGGSAGIQADLKTFAAHGVFGMSALTVVTAQNTVGVQATYPIPVDLIKSQIQSVLTDMSADGVKTGFLGGAAVVELVSSLAQQWHDDLSLVVDPVLINGLGQQIVTDETVTAYRNKLFPQATLVTPNLGEASLLAGLEHINDRTTMQHAARKIFELANANRNATHLQLCAVLIKGLLIENGATILNLLFDGQRFYPIQYPRLPIHNPHGVGCTLSAAITVNLAQQKPLQEAVHDAFKYLYAALRGALDWQLGAGRLPVNHHYLHTTSNKRC